MSTPPLNRLTANPLIDKKTYTLDWMRVICIHLVMLSSSIFEVDEAIGTAKNRSQLFIEKKDFILRQLVQYGVPLLFYLSGLSAQRCKTETVGFWKFVWKKFKQLLVPFTYSFILFQLPRLYIGQDFQSFSLIDSFERQEWNPIEYFKKVMKQPSIVRVGQLWFLPILFIVSVGSYPLLAFSRRRRMDMPLGWSDLYYGLQQMLMLGAINYLYFKNVEGEKFWKHMFPQICILWCSFISYFLVQIYLQKRAAVPGPFKSCGLLMLIGPIAHVFMNIFSLNEQMSLYQTMTMSIYHFHFMMAGLLEGLWWEYVEESFNYFKKQPYFVPWIILFIFCNTLFAPGASSDMGPTFTYPLYKQYLPQTLFVLGSWQNMYFILYVGKHEFERPFEPVFYDHFIKWGMIAYLCSEFWITVGIRSLVMPLPFDVIPMVPSIGLVYIFTEIMSLLTYYLIYRLVRPSFEEPKGTIGVLMFENQPKTE